VAESAIAAPAEDHRNPSRWFRNLGSRSGLRRHRRRNLSVAHASLPPDPRSGLSADAIRGSGLNHAGLPACSVCKRSTGWNIKGKLCIMARRNSPFAKGETIRMQMLS
jgi:hypothetical protein